MIWNRNKLRSLPHLLALLLSVTSLLAGAALAWHHPVWPTALLAGWGVGLLVVLWRPGVWLWLVPASLPLLNFSPWTGWLVFEEFDILLLAVLAGGYGRWAYRHRAGAGGAARAGFVGWLLALLAGSALGGLALGFADAGGFSFDWFAGYADALNSLRVFKSLGFALLLWPLLAQETNASRTRAGQHLARGMVAGLVVVTLAVLWERLAFPGVFNFSAHYRTVALFWEMHVGGAAIDTYLAMAAPFVVWALVAARHPVQWAGAAALALLTVYAGLTTFSRGVYFAVLGSLLLLAALLWAQKIDQRGRAFSRQGRRYPRHQRGQGWRIKAGWLLAVVLVAEVAAVLGGGTFMTERVQRTDRDLGSRMDHWQQGLALLQSPSDWLLGKGLGRLPANYARQGAKGEFPGDIKVSEEPATGLRGNTFVTLRGPSTRRDVGGLYALTQRVNLASNGPYQIRMTVRVQQASDVELKVCERHLLYDGHCQTARVHLAPRHAAWQALVLGLNGPVLAAGSGYAPRLGMFSLAVVNVGGVLDVDHVRLVGLGPQDVLENGDFSHQLAHWFPAAQLYFLPWHIDNFFLEVLLERGVTGLLCLVAMLALALWHLVFGHARLQALSPYLAASLCGALLVGLVSSFMDVPRVAFLFFLVSLFSISSSATRHIQHR